MKKTLLCSGLLMFLLLFQAAGENSATNAMGQSKAFARNRNIGRGMNFGNALEAPKEGAWGLTLQESHVQAVADYAYHGSIEKLAIPGNETNVIVSVKYYLPYDFTHQGAHWAAGSDQWLGTKWSGNSNEVAVVDADLKFVKDWSEKNKRPITVGEFGAIAIADQQSRVTWTKSVREKFEANGFSWCYFDFGVIFKAYDIEKHDWLPGFKEALVGH